MQFPLTFDDIQLVLTVTAIVLVVMRELTSPRHGLTNLAIDRKRLKNATYTAVLFFVVMVIVRGYAILAGF